MIKIETGTTSKNGKWSNVTEANVPAPIQASTSQDPSSSTMTESQVVKGFIFAICPFLFLLFCRAPLPLPLPLPLLPLPPAAVAAPAAWLTQISCCALQATRAKAQTRARSVPSPVRPGPARIALPTGPSCCSLSTRTQFFSSSCWDCPLGTLRRRRRRRRRKSTGRSSCHGRSKFLGSGKILSVPVSERRCHRSSKQVRSGFLPFY